MNDKNIELNRYNSRASRHMVSSNYIPVNCSKSYLQSPYNSYKQLLKRSENQSNVLEIGAGMGENTNFLLDMHFDKIYATDISPKSVEIIKKRFSGYAGFSAETADMERLPFDDNSFDVVCSAGSLSYGDNRIVMNEIYRVLKQGGVMVVVDSLNNNPIYRFNRYLHYLRGNRSKSTLKRMPTINLIEMYNEKFGYTEVRFFGAITWLSPIINKVLTDEIVAKFSDWIDAIFNIKKSAFKFTMKAVKNEK
jgi:ubiquinone/menaquinone biosynthesis C-methylase UbiE